MIERLVLPSHDEIEVPAFLDTGDAAALERWKQAHPDWFVAGHWTPPRRPASEGRGPGERAQVQPVWDGGQAGALDPAGLSLADFQAVRAAAMQASAAGPAAAPAPDAAGAAEPQHNRAWWWLHDHGLAQTLHEKADGLRRSMGSAGGSVFMRDGQRVEIDAMSDDEVIALDKEFRGVGATPWPAGVVAPTMTSWGWKDQAPYKKAVEELKKAGTHETVNGRVPTEDEAVRMIQESGGVVDRIEDGHPLGFNSPHSERHINYYANTPTGLKKATIYIKER